MVHCGGVKSVGSFPPMDSEVLYDFELFPSSAPVMPRDANLAHLPREPLLFSLSHHYAWNALCL